MKEYDIPTKAAVPYGLCVGPDGNLWFTERQGNKIARLSPKSGSIVEYQVPTAQAGPVGITVGPDGDIWFTESTSNKLGKLSLH